MWTTKGREGENAALVIAAGLVMAMTTEGELVVLRNDPKAADVVKRYTMAESPGLGLPGVRRERGRHQGRGFAGLLDVLSKASTKLRAKPRRSSAKAA